MKKLAIITVLAVAFIFSLVFLAEAKVYHFEINGVPYAAYKKADGNYESFEVTAEYHAKFKSQVPQKTFSQQETPKKAILPVLAKKIIQVTPAPISEVPAQNVAVATPVQKKVKKFIKIGKTRNEFYGEGKELQVIDSWVAKIEKEKTRQIAEKVSPGAVSEVSANVVSSKKKEFPAQTKSPGSADITNNKITSPAPLPQHRVPMHSQKLLVDWEVRERTYQLSKNGKKELVRDYLRSPAECYEKIKPGYKKSGFEYKERYDRHTYVSPTEKPVEPGTVVLYALDPKPDSLTMSSIVRDAGEKMEIFCPETGHFILVDKPRALQVEYITPYYKRFKEVQVMPSEFY